MINAESQVPPQTTEPKFASGQDSQVILLYKEVWETQILTILTFCPISLIMVLKTYADFPLLFQQLIFKRDVRVIREMRGWGGR